MFLFKDAGKAPPALITNRRHNNVLHSRTFLLSVETADVPRVPEGQRAVTVLVGQPCGGEQPANADAIATHLDGALATFGI